MHTIDLQSNIIQHKTTIEKEILSVNRTIIAQYLKYYQEVLWF